MMVIASLLHHKQRRGMSVMHDLVDWMGGFPFEFARFDVLKDYLCSRDFEFEQGKCAFKNLRTSYAGLEWHEERFHYLKGNYYLVGKRGGKSKA